MTFADNIILECDAIFIADSHFKQGNKQLLKFFYDIPKNKQVFLMGDIFHLFIGALQGSYEDNIELIEAIAYLSQTNQIIFLEGNHDFYLRNVWREKTWKGQNPLDSKNIIIFPYHLQPIVIKNKHNDYCILAHGDLWINTLYDNYRKIINNPLLLFAFNIFNKLSYGIIYKKFASRINHRKIEEFSFFRSDFADFMGNRIIKYQKHVVQPMIQQGIATNNDRFYIIEGHFHLGKSLEEGNIIYNALCSSYFHRHYFTL